MASRLLNRTFSLKIIESEEVFILRSIMTRYRYDENNNRTNEIIGYTYDVTNSNSYELYKVVIEHTKPLMEPTKLLELREKGEKVAVSFINPTIRAYHSKRTDTYDDIVKADDIFLAQEYEL